MMPIMPSKAITVIGISIDLMLYYSESEVDIRVVDLTNGLAHHEDSSSRLIRPGIMIRLL